MNIAGKCWGKTSLLFHRNNIEVHRIEVKPGGYCSKHKHLHKNNAFYVETGDLQVSVWKNSYDLIDETDLREGDYMEVPPGEYHQFKSEGGCLAFEIYWVELDPGDIERAGVGGNDETNYRPFDPDLDVIQVSSQPAEGIGPIMAQEMPGWPTGEDQKPNLYHGYFNVTLGKWWDNDLNQWTNSPPTTGG